MEKFPAYLLKVFLTTCAILVPGSAFALANAGEQAGDVVRISSILPISQLEALFPVIGLIVAVGATQLLRRRKIAQLRTGASSTR